MYHDSLLKKLNNKTAVIGIIGMGYVGLPLMLRYVEAGYKVYGIDSDKQKVAYLNQGSSYINHISSKKITGALESGNFQAISDFSYGAKVDALILCVPTPLNKYREPDLSFVISSIESLAPYLKKGQVISLESTTYPGTTAEELKPRIESTGLKVGEDVFLVFSPEREDPGNLNFDTKTTPKICGADTNKCLTVGVALYSQVIDQVVPVSSTRTAEMAKLLENIHRAVNIGLVNEMKIVADKMKIDIHEVIRAAATKPFGFVPYYPGPGLGGHCIPIDPFYLTWKAREYGVNTRFIELAGEINRSMPEWVISKVVDSLNYRNKPIKGCRALILGIAYKKNIDDMRESPSVELMKVLHEKGAIISYSDPHVPISLKKYNCLFDMQSEILTAESIASYDFLLLATNHDAFDYALIKRHAKLIIDTRGVYLDIANNVIKA